MRRPIAAFLAASFVLLAAPIAHAVPAQVHIRVEGKTETLFEGPILTDAHRVKAANDSLWRRCNGVTALDPSAAGGAVPMSATSDAMRILGETFDGRWYSQWEDYFVERWGPDAQNVASAEYWGLLVNNAFTDVGGCQYQLDAGDEVLWVYDAFDGRPRLLLYPADYSGGALPQSVTATLNQPFEVEVDSWSSSNEDVPPPSPTRSTSFYPGAEVAPVETGVDGFQKVDVASSKTVVTGADGQASITFTEPGWHRIKATDLVASTEVAVRSNRLDVCVPQPPAVDCGPLPPDAVTRMPPSPDPNELEEEEKDPKEGQPAGSDSQQGVPPPQSLPVTDARPVRLGSARLDRRAVARGLVKVSWRVLDAGVGIAKWTIAAKRIARKDVRWTIRARGRDRTSATVRLPAGARYKLRLTVTDLLGNASIAPLGKVQIPE
jgi:hypothetical protein